MDYISSSQFVTLQRDHCKELDSSEDLKGRSFLIDAINKMTMIQLT